MTVNMFNQTRILLEGKLYSNNMQTMGDLPYPGT